MKYNWIRSNKKRTVRNSCRGRENSKKGVDLIKIQLGKKGKKHWIIKQDI